MKAMKENVNPYINAIKIAMKVEFLSSRKEFFLYTNALYSAMMWSREVDRKNKEMRRKDTSVK